MHIWRLHDVSVFSETCGDCSVSLAHPGYMWQAISGALWLNKQSSETCCGPVPLQLYRCPYQAKSYHYSWWAAWKLQLLSAWPQLWPGMEQHGLTWWRALMSHPCWMMDGRRANMKICFWKAMTWTDSWYICTILLRICKVLHHEMNFVSVSKLLDIFGEICPRFWNLKAETGGVFCGFVAQLSYYRTETTRHMHILDEACIKDEEGGRPVIGTDCVLWLRHRVLQGAYGLNSEGSWPTLIWWARKDGPLKTCRQCQES